DLAPDAETTPEPTTLPDEEATAVLIVEDHADVRRYLREHLQADYQVIEAKDGLEGMEVAREAIPDLVISDVMMPGQDGYALCAALKTDEKTSHIPVILLTARAGEEDTLTGLETGADDYLLKPFHAKELQVRVRNLIEQRRALRRRFLREGMMRPKEVTVTSLDDQFLQKVMTTIEARLADERFSVEELSHEVNMTPRHLHRKLRALTGKTPVQLIRFVRLSRARQLLEQRAGTVSEIAYQVGFSNLSYFARVFREEFGKLPSEI
ncbi:MAG: DNA-binding response regulator, partial [Chloroflexi bacterium]